MLKDAVKERDVKILWHFTRLSNLESILDIGLLPRSQFTKFGLNPDINDEYRYDECSEANCLSISFPNYKMFFKYRKQDESVEWVVLGIKTDVLWQKDCAFCVTNAASASVRFIPLPERKGIAAFNKLFDEIEGKPNREKLKLPKFYPTDPQAEVLVFDRIEPEFIIGAAFNSEDKVNIYKSRYSDFDFVQNSNLFSARVDYQVWKTGS